MKQRRYLSVILALSMVLTMPGLAYGTEPDAFDAASQDNAALADFDVKDMDGEKAAENKLLVLVEEGTSKKEVKTMTEDAGASVDTLNTLDDGKKLVSVDLDKTSDAEDVAGSLAAEDKVLIVQPNYRYKLQTETEDAEELQDGQDSAPESNELPANESSDGEKTSPEEPADAESVDIGADTTGADSDEDGNVPLMTKSASGKKDLETEAASGADSEDIRLENESGRRRTVDEKIEGSTITQWYMGESHPGSTRGGKTREELLSSTDTADKVKVAVIDTGVKLDHPDLEGVIREDDCIAVYQGNEYNFDGSKKSGISYEGTKGSPDKSDDDDGHGTHVCGLIAAKTGDEFGISGISANRAELIVIDAENDDIFETVDVVVGINHAIKNGANVINMSLGGLVEDYILEDRINHAVYNKNVLCVCAAGNEDSSLPETPGDASGAISVIAHDENANKAGFSNYGKEKEVSAPGTDIVSTYVDKRYPGEIVYKYLSGTSMATPLVTGLAALIKSEDESLKAREIRNYIYTSSGSGTFSDNAGFGRVDAYNAVAAVNATSVNPSSVVLNKTSVSMHTGETTGIEYAVYPAAASRYADELTFKSSDTTVASVNENGLISAVSAGTATITAECKGVSVTCAVTVKDLPYTKVDRLPYVVNGAFSPGDYKTSITYNKAKYSAFADGYEIKSSADRSDIKIAVTCREAVPYIRVMDASGNEINVNVAFTDANGKQISEKDMEKYEGVIVARASFKPGASKTYRIQALGVNYGSAEENKRYNIRIETSAGLSEASVGGIVNRTYTGGYIYQNPVLKYNGYTLREGEDYMVAYLSNRSVGTARVIFTGLGAYTGSVSKSFRINPRGTTLGKLKKGKRAITVKWARRSTRMPYTRIYGYQVQLATNKSFTKNKKTVNVKGYRKTSKKISKLKKKKRYYVRVRTYMKAGGRNYYSRWSSVKSIKTG